MNDDEEEKGFVRFEPGDAFGPPWLRSGFEIPILEKK
jgi:hypothetical protein